MNSFATFRVRLPVPQTLARGRARWLVFRRLERLENILMPAGSYGRLSYCKLGNEQSKDIVGCQMRVACLLTGVIHRRAVIPATGTSLDFPVAGDLRHRDEGFLQQTEESSLRRVLFRLPRSVSLAVPHRGT